MAEASAVQTFKFGDGGGLRLSASGRTDNDFSSSVPVSSTLPRAQNDRFALDADSVFRLGAGVQLGLEVTHSVAATNDFDSSYTVAHDHHDTSSVKGGLTADTAYGLWQATVYHNWLSQNNYGALRSVFEFNAQETVAQLQDLFKIGAEHNFRVSLEYRHNEVGTTPFAGASIFYDDYAANAMWDWKVAPVLSLTTALRWNNLKLGRVGPVPAGYPFVNEDWQRTFADINYNVGLVWKASQSDTLRLILSEGEQLPSLANLGAVLLASPVMNITGSPEVEATEVKNYEIDWDRALPFIGGAFRAAGFYEESTEIITIAGLPIPGSGPPPYSSMGNVGNSNAYGAEFSLKGLFAADWRWGLNYRFESVFDDFVPYAQNGTAYVDFAHVTPKHLVKANLGWARGNWEIDGYVYYQSPTRGLATLPLVPGTFLTPVPGYVSADARIAYRLTDWATFSISGQNLLQSKQRQTSGPAVERRIFGTLSVNF